MADNTTRKPRGRPPGSKNKPKKPIVTTIDGTSTMKHLTFEISAGSDIIDSVVSFARSNAVGVCINSANGAVSNVTFCHPFSHAPAQALQGPFDLLFLSGSFVSPDALSSSNKTAQSSSSSLFSSGRFRATLAGPQGQVFRGMIGGKLMAETQVIVEATTFVNPEVHMLALRSEDDEKETKPGAATESVYGVASPTLINFI